MVLYDIPYRVWDGYYDMCVLMNALISQGFVNSVKKGGLAYAMYQCVLYHIVPYNRHDVQCCTIPTSSLHQSTTSLQHAHMKDTCSTDELTNL